jgi:hypothetical protein
MSFSELPNLHEIATPKSRKEHKCYECGGVIQKGEKYQSYSGHWNDLGFERYKTCCDCAQLRDELCEGRDGDDWPPFGELTLDCSETEGEWLERMVAIKTKRGGKVRDWMLEQLEEAKNGSKQ